MHSRGVTLVELVATLAVLAIITALAAPNMGRWLETQQATTAHNALLGSLHLARAHAVTSGQRTVVCKSADGRTCASEGSWNQGWMVFEDFGDEACTDTSGTGVCDEGGRILGTHRGFTTRWIRISHNQNIARRVVYPPHGTQRVHTNGTFSYCSVRDGRVLGGTVIAPSGRVRRAQSSEPGVAC